MAGAAESLAEALNGVRFESGKRRFFSTTESRYPEPEELAEVLARQLMSPVKFVQSMQALMAGPDAPTEGLECGPGGVLAGLTKRIVGDLKVASTGDAASFEAALGAIKQTGGA
jgi:[acyl-carrier-protein] S-malonyltransferase